MIAATVVGVIRAYPDSVCFLASASLAMAASHSACARSLARTVQERTAERSVGLYRGGRYPTPSRGHPNRGETTEQFRLHTLFGLTPLFSHDVWLHAGTAVIAAYFGWGPVDVRDEVVGRA
jgi:hypothetical protein